MSKPLPAGEYEIRGPEYGCTNPLVGEWVPATWEPTKDPAKFKLVPAKPIVKKLTEKAANELAGPGQPWTLKAVKKPAKPAQKASE